MLRSATEIAQGLGRTKEALEQSHRTITALRGQFQVVKRELELTAKQWARMEVELRDRRRFWGRVWLAVGVVVLTAFTNAVIEVITQLLP